MTARQKLVLLGWGVIDDEFYYLGTDAAVVEKDIAFRCRSEGGEALAPWPFIVNEREEIITG